VARTVLYSLIAMRSDPMPHLLGWTTAALVGLAAVVITTLVSGCASDPGAATVDRITPANATIDLDDVEVFPQRVGLVLAPGSGMR